MKIIHDFDDEYQDGINTNLKLTSFSDDDPNIVLFSGLGCTYKKELHEQFKNYSRRIFLNLADPCGLYAPHDKLGQNHFQQHEFFTDVFSICPMTVEWCNNQTNSNKWKYVFYPFNPDMWENASYNKKYDICYAGGIHSLDHLECVNIIRKFNYKFISLFPFDGVTDLNVTTREKCNIISETKISVCYNTLYLTEDHVHQFLAYPNIKEHKAFSPDFVYPCGKRLTIPQFKSRAHEAAYSKSLLLVKKDNWNIMKDYYKGQDFTKKPETDIECLYFDHNNDLFYIIDHIIQNWNDYQHVVDNAYNKSLNFTVQNMIEFIKENL